MNRTDQNHTQPMLGTIRREHRELNRMLRGITQQLAQTPGQRVLHDAHHQLGDRLHALRSHLQRHFSQEDCGGCIDEAVARAPRLAAEASTLEHQHPELLLSLDTVIAEFEHRPTSVANWQFVADQFAQFSRKLLAHEATENRILSQGFNEDLELDD